MKIAIIYDVNDIKKKKFSINLKETLIKLDKDKLNKEDTTVDMYKSSENITCIYDVYILVVYNINELISVQEKIKEANKVLVLTDNTDVKFIIYCVNYTKNLCYLNVDITTILGKIYSIYQTVRKDGL